MTFRPDVPLGARLLGCRNCTVGDRQRHPELGMVYCASCPVALSQQTGVLHAVPYAREEYLKRVAEAEAERDGGQA